MKKSTPLLVILTPGFPEGEYDSTCLPFLQSLVKAINRQFSSIEVMIFSFQYPYIKSPYLWNGNVVIPFNGRNRGKVARRLLWLRVWRKLISLRTNHNLAGVFSLWCGETALIGHRFANRSGVPHYCWVLGQEAKAGNKYVDKTEPRAEELIAISDFIADEFFKNYLLKPQHVIPNGIDQSLFEKDSFVRTIDVLGAGSLIPLKQYEVFIDCIAIIKKSFPKIYSVISGKGEEHSKLNEQIKAQGLQKNVMTTGELSHKSLLRLMQQAKIFLHPSSYEGFSMVCLEALYAGCHVISFCKPMKQDFEHWHVVKSKEEMIQKATELLRIPNLEYTSVMPYSVEQTASSIMHLFSR
jgi:glycosyltransferase involved in cell wall biosynthesis